MSERWAPNVTVAVIVEHEGAFLMVEERINGRRSLNQPAGHLEPGESLVEAATREVFEETRWRVEVTELLGIHRWQDTESDESWLRFVFCATPLREEAGPLDPPVVAVHWLDRDALNKTTTRHRSPLVQAAFDAYESAHRIPLDALRDLFG